MDPSTTAAALAAASALAAYVNAKYHVAQDIKALRFKRSSTKHYEQLGMHLPHLPLHRLATATSTIAFYSC